MSLEDLRPFFEIHTLSPEGWPVFCNVTVPNERALAAWSGWPGAAFPASGRAGAGKGTTPEDAARSGLGEIIEMASLCRWADDTTVCAAREDLPGATWDTGELLGFSSRQIAESERWNQSLRGLDRIPRRVRDTGEWLPARDLDGQTVWVAADAVLLDDFGRSDGTSRSLADTNGAAAGATHRQAQTAALLELIERDATGRWWYGQRSRPAIDRNHISGAAEDILIALQARGLKVRLLDITTDLGVPVVAAICADKTSSPVSVGFAAAPELLDAVLKALCEMAQMQLLFELNCAREGLDPWKQEVSLRTPPLFPGEPTKLGKIETEDGGLANSLRTADVRIAYINRTRPEFDLPVWRAISPDLCHWKPRFGRKRLLEYDGRDLGTTPARYNPILLRI